MVVAAATNAGLQGDHFNYSGTSIWLFSMTIILSYKSDLQGMEITIDLYFIKVYDAVK